MLFLEYLDEVGFPKILMNEILEDKDKHVYFFRIKGKAHIAPKWDLKILQKILKDYLFKYHYSSNISKNATAYISGKNISFNVKKHQGNSYFFVTDFKNFFPSISYAYIKKVLYKILKEESDKDIELILNIITYKDKLQYGFPTSPIISNIIMKEFDEIILKKIKDEFHEKDNIQYSRYSDDITISSKYSFEKKKVFEIIKNLLKNEYSFLLLNHKKTRFFEKYSRKPYITGLIPLTKRITIGKKKYNFIKANIFVLINKKDIHNENFYDSIKSLSGYLSYVYLVDKHNYFRLKSSFKINYENSIEYKQIFKK